MVSTFCMLLHLRRPSNRSPRRRRNLSVCKYLFHSFCSKKGTFKRLIKKGKKKLKRELLRFTFETRVSAGTHIRRLVAFVNAMADTVAHPFRISKFQVFQAGAHLRLVRPVQAIIPSIAERASIHAFPIPASKFHPRAIFERY